MYFAKIFWYKYRATIPRLGNEAGLNYKKRFVRENEDLVSKLKIACILNYFSDFHLWLR